MFKIFALIFICVGVYIGINYSDQVENIMETEAFEKIQDRAEEGKEALLEKIEDAKG